MTFPKYTDVLEAGKALLDKLKAPIKAMQARKKIELLQLQIDEQIAGHEIEIHNLFDAVEFDPKAVYNLSNKIDLLKRERAFYDTLIQESFS